MWMRRILCPFNKAHPKGEADGTANDFGHLEHISHIIIYVLDFSAIPKKRYEDMLK
jgi:hypothetical protein